MSHYLTFGSKLQFYAVSSHRKCDARHPRVIYVVDKGLFLCLNFCCTCPSLRPCQWRTHAQIGPHSTAINCRKGALLGIFKVPRECQSTTNFRISPNRGGNQYILACWLSRRNPPPLPHSPVRRYNEVTFKHQCFSQWFEHLATTRLFWEKESSFKGPRLHDKENSLQQNVSGRRENDKLINFKIRFSQFPVEFVLNIFSLESLAEN